MKFIAAFGMVLLAGAIAVPAQQVSGSQQSFGAARMESLAPSAQPAARPPAITILNGGTASLCSIGMDVSQRGGLQLLHAGTNGAGKDGKFPPPGMMPTLTLRGPDGKHIAFASITAYGYAAATGATPLQTGTPSSPARPGGSLNLTNSPAQRKKLIHSLTIGFRPEGDGEDSSDFTLPGFVTLSSIQLHSVTYTDGTIWNTPAPNACRVSPSPLVLVGGNH